jgi:hypothetical protein
MNAGDAFVIVTRERSTMFSTWIEGMCLTKINKTEFELFIGGFVPVAESLDYIDEQTGKEDIPDEIDGYPVRGVYDGVIIGGEIERDLSEGGIKFTDLESVRVKEWIENVNWNYCKTFKKIQETMVNKIKWSDPFISFYHVFKKEMILNPNLDANTFLELEKENPIDTVSINNINSEIGNSEGATHETETFYICKVPELGDDAYLLFSIYWDTDWELWKKKLGCACVGASSHIEASKYLLKQNLREDF